MYSKSFASFVVLAAFGSALAGCSGAQEVEIKGVAEAAATASVQGPITIDFFEVPEADDETSEAILSIELAQLGEFTETVEVEGDEIRIFALADADSDGKCTEGEAWAEARAAVKEDGTVDQVVLKLDTTPCPQ